jgi:hypothetical protein
MRVRRETVEHPFGTLKMRMAATHFLMKRLPKVATEMALHVLAYNITCAINIIGTQPLRGRIRGRTQWICRDRLLRLNFSGPLASHAELGGQTAGDVSGRSSRSARR